MRQTRTSNENEIKCKNDSGRKKLANNLWSQRQTEIGDVVIALSCDVTE